MNEEIEKIEKIIEGVKPTIGQDITDWKSRVAEAIYDAGYRLPVEGKELRKQMTALRHEEFGCGTHKCPHWQKDCLNYDWVVDEGLCPEMIDQILALIRPIELKVLGDEDVQDLNIPTADCMRCIALIHRQAQRDYDQRQINE